jgi:formate hydrogenlyase transcriptional activator
MTAVYLHKVGASSAWRYAIAFVAVTVVALVRYFLDIRFGSAHPFVLFWPVVMLAALLEGFWLGLFTTTSAAVCAWYLFVLPANSFALFNTRDVIGLILFMVIGTTMSAVGDLFRRRRHRLQEFEKVVEGVKEMIVVVDRDYRYLIANEAFLRLHGMKGEELIGRRIAGVLNPGVFEAVIKQKLDECFSGRIVQFEMSYQYPVHGERRLHISYFPVGGRRKGMDRVACILHDITDERESERSLKLFRTLIDQSNDAVEVVDPETLRLLDVNDGACKDLGYSREELLSLSVYDIDPNAREGWEVKLREKLRDAGSLLTETIHRRRDGSTFPVETSLKFVKLDRSYVVAVSRDISERKAVEEALRESEDRYRDLVENSEDLVCTHDLDGRLLSVNAAAARILGYEPGELVKTPMRDLIVPEYRQLFDAYLARIKVTGADKGLMVVLPRTGEPRTWEYSNTLRTEGVSSPIVRGMAHDVTERRHVEIALSGSEKKYRLLFEKNLAGVAIASLEGKVVDCNDAWAQILGYGCAEEVRGRPTADFYYEPASRKPLMEELKRDGALFSREMQLRRKDGTPVWVLFNAILQSHNGGPPSAQSTIIDISERKRAEEALRRREEDYRRFVAQSSEGIFREELCAPVSVTLPEEELIQHILCDSRLADCNDAMARMYGFTSSQEMVGRRLTDFLVADNPRNVEMTRDYIRSGFRVLDRESEEVDSQGQPKAFRNSLIGFVEDGNLVRTWGIQRDVTEQVRLEKARAEAESALRKSEEHFRILVEQASDGIFVADEHGRYLDVNTAGAQMLGYTREEILKLSICDVIAPSEVERLSFEIGRFGGSPIVRSDWLFRRKDGSLFSGEVCGKQLPDGRLQGIVRDITERKQAEEAMRRSEERFQVSLKDSPITVFNQDCDLRYTWIYNPQLYWQQDVLGKTDEEILGPRKSANLTSLKRRVLETGVAVREEVSLPSNGKRFALDMNIEPVFGSAGDIIGITGACIDIAKLRELADRLQESRDQLEKEKSYLEEEIRTELGFGNIIGTSPALRQILDSARVVAPTDSTVLLLGETGTGKELVARSIHTLSSRRSKTFIKLNCAAVPSGLLESELFGHEKGAFTGAVSQKVGRIELAHKGTLFLDEIGELPQELQPKLLRLLQDREFERLGSVHTVRVDVRIIAATNRDLRQDVADKKFREDLYYRLHVFPIQLPPLRDRKSDIPMLVRHFVNKHTARMGKEVAAVPDETMKTLQRWAWPGNVRELENVIERMIIMSDGGVLAAPPAELEASGDTAPDDLSEMEREHIMRVLRETNGVLSGADGAAARLALKRTTLQSMLKRFGIEAGDFRRGNGI